MDPKQVAFDTPNREALLQSIFKSAPVGIGLVVNRTFQWTNERMSEICGYTADELQGQTSRMLYSSKEEFEWVGREKYKQIKAKGTGSVDTKFVHKDGTVIDVHISSTPINPDDLSEGVTFTALDITDRKQAEEEIVRNKEQWERTFNSFTDIVTLQDIDMTIVKINKAGCDTVEESCENIIGLHCYELFHGSTEPCPECPLLKTKKTFEPYSKEITHEKLGKTFIVSAAPVLDDKGNLTHIAHVAKDITEKKKIEECLFLNEKMATIAGLAAGVAHEINTPLSAILQSQQMIEMRLSPDTLRNQRYASECGVDLAKVEDYFKQREIDVFMSGMRESAINASRIIKNLLEFSRPHKSDIVPTDLTKLLDNTLQLARADYGLKKQYDIINVAIKKEYNTDLSNVPCVPTEIEQVILNLIKNAVHAIADNNTPNPTITVRTSKTDQTARIEIEDNGPGLDGKTSPHIFDPFFTTKDVGSRTGLGLSISHAIIHDKHMGNIWVESEVGKGAKFVIELPLVQEIKGVKTST